MCRSENTDMRVGFDVFYMGVSHVVILSQKQPFIPVTFFYNGLIFNAVLFPSTLSGKFHSKIFQRKVGL